MKQLFYVLGICSLVLIACEFSTELGGLVETIEGSGNIITEERAVGEFTHINILGSGDLIISQGEQSALTVETDDNWMHFVKTEVRNGTLELGFTSAARTKNLQTSRGFIYRATVQQLESVDIGGSGRVFAEDIEGDVLVIRISGSGEVRITNLIASDLSVQVIGSGDIELSGEAPQQSYLIGGSGTIKAGDLRGETVEVTIPGSASVTVWATESLEVNMAGSGSVGYYGSADVTHSILGTGNLSSLGDK
jgi:hypothetical protein